MRHGKYGKMRIFIVGGSGFIGSNIVRQFLTKGDEVYVFVRKASNLWKLNDILQDINFVYGDLRHESSIFGALMKIKPDVTINCSGLVAGFSVEDQKDVIQSNFINTVNIVNACLSANVEMLISTGSAYECGFSPNPIFKTNCNKEPIGLYGITKRAERLYIESINKKYKKQYITARLFTPFGYFDSTKRLIPYIITSLIFGQTPNIKDPNSVRDFIFIDDVAKIYYELTHKPELLGNIKTMDIGSGVPTKVSEVASILFKMFNIQYDINMYQTSSSNNYIYSKGEILLKLKNEIKLYPTPLKDALEKTKVWFEKNKFYYKINNTGD